mgnify:CR=1 FL=1
MKNIPLYIFLFLALVSCSDLRFGDAFLGDAPESSGATLDTMFVSAANADKVLNNAYRHLPYGLPTGNDPILRKMGLNILEALTDLHYSCRNNISDGPVNLYYNGSLSPNISTSSKNTEAYTFGNEYEYTAIRYAWIYIENAGRIPDITETMRNRRIAEAKMITAVSYAEMLRYMGGVPLLKRAVDVTDEMRFPRATFAETVDYIVQLIDEAAPFLNWREAGNDDGRMTKAGALALKLRVLLFAASPTFNSDTKWHPQADEYTCYGNCDPARWQAAVAAGDDFFSELDRWGYYGLVLPDTETPRARRLAFRKGYYERGSSELLISTRRSYSSSVLGPFLSQRLGSGPTLNYVNMFPWADGSDFPEDFDWTAPFRQPFFDEGGNLTRDPRLYETVTVPGDIYYDGTVAPLHTNHTNFFLATGFMQMKFILQQTSDRGTPIQWPYIRLSEVLLSYAEALNEVNGGPTPKAYECVNGIRGRMGLPGLKGGMTKEQFREALLRERALEFGFEEVRWFDLVRYGREADFRKHLYGLTSKGDNPNNPTKFTFRTYQLKDRYWVGTWDTKWYLSPVPNTEINKHYGMTQNPGWQASVQ